MQNIFSNFLSHCVILVKILKPTASYTYQSTPPYKKGVNATSEEKRLVRKQSFTLYMLHLNIVSLSSVIWKYKDNSL